MAGELKMNPTCKPKVDTTNTEAVWKQRVAEGGWFLKFDEGTTTADEMGVDFLAANDKWTIGRLIGYTGTGDKFRVTVETCRVYGYAGGTSGQTGAYASTDWGDRMKAGSDGKLQVDNAQTDGNIFLVGGTKDEPAVAWQWPYN